jgi:hypothetical protein
MLVDRLRAAGADLYRTLHLILAGLLLAVLCVYLASEGADRGQSATPAPGRRYREAAGD